MTKSVIWIAFGKFLREILMQYWPELMQSEIENVQQVAKIDSLEEELQALKEESGRDDLTGLLKRNGMKRAFHRHAHKIGRTAVRISHDAGERYLSMPQTHLLFIDADHFKSVNDNYGHAMGDQVLVAIAKVITSSIREDDIPARYGGEEFVVVISNANASEAAGTAERIRHAVENLTFNGQIGSEAVSVLRVTLSIGVARINLDPHNRYDDIDQKLEEANVRADIAMYEAKNTGRNRIVIAPDQE